VYKAELERAKARQQTVKAKVMKTKTQQHGRAGMGHADQFYGMKRINARGLPAAKQKH